MIFNQERVTSCKLKRLDIILRGKGKGKRKQGGEGTILAPVKSGVAFTSPFSCELIRFEIYG
jgi:hypothetical protein